ncbi:hypothetical protein S40293_02162 [Stachybotrys chartarum IBT 40293]|nr:hypothetical protein S40293_02162 [Stachybotrys chartarum IBT 40293]
MHHNTNTMAESVAIIGSSCRFPGSANSPSKLWDLLQRPVDLLAEIPKTRFDPAGFYHENAEHPGTTNATKAYLMDEDPWAFDNDFFSISAREAESMDPQQRIILETVYESIESAGYSISQLKGSSTGVFVGQMSDDYRDLLLRDLDSHPQYAGTGIARSILANRVSYVFDWKGPSVNTDTACSSSLVALHQAVQSLRSGECEMAVVAGVNLVFSPELFSFLSSLRMLSPHGRSRMWDISADGYARGEGFAAIVIKRLDRAQADGDDIESIIRNTGVNQDGRSAGLTVPSAAAQAALMKATYARCGLDCQKEEDRCQYFEAHGTGTPAGDPKEAEGINTTFFSNRSQAGINDASFEKMRVGSIKTIIGHLEGTAGLASLLKASLAVKYGLIPPNLHFDRLNPAIEPYYEHLKVPTELEEWPKLPPGVPRRASVNSFGFGGTNAHVIVESWNKELEDAIPANLSPCLGPFVLSANSESALTTSVVSLSEALKSKDIDLARLAWTLQARRTLFTHRASFSATTKEELIKSLDNAIANKSQSPIAAKAAKVSDPRILGVFTGQGAQWATMGTSLYQHSAIFRNTINQLESTLKTLPHPPSWSLSHELLRNDDPSRIASAEISQPLCTALQVALVDLLRESGVEFSAVVGHSSGEIAAAYAAGIIGATEAIVVAYYRGYHSHRAKNENGSLGKMMAVGMDPKDADDLCRQPQFVGRMNVAAKNSSSSVTLSGDAKAIADAKVLLDGQKVFARILKVDTAYHSHHMQPVRAPYLAALKEAGIKPRRNHFAGACNWYSSVYDARGGSAMTTPVSFEHTYWADNMSNAVLFSSAVAAAVEEEHFDLALEIGPHPALRGPAIETIRDILGSPMPYHGVLERGKDAIMAFSDVLGFIWRSLDVRTPLVDFAGFHKACHGSDWTPPRVHKGLPSYCWDHDRSLVRESKISKVWRGRSTPGHELLGWPTSKNGEIHWRNVLRLADVEWLQGHQFQGQVLFPGAGYLVMAVEAALHLAGPEQSIQLIELQNVLIHNGITLEDGSAGVDLNFVTRIVEESPAGKLAEFFCHGSNVDTSSPDFDKKIVTGRVFIKFGPPEEDILPQRITQNLPMTDVSTDRFYTWMQKIGLNYSDPFVLDSIKRRLNFASITSKRIVSDRYTVHPGTLDSILQGLYAAFSYAGDGRVWTTYLPKSFRRVCFNINPSRQISDNDSVLADCFLTEASARIMSGDIDVFSTADGHAEIQLQGVVLSSLEVPSATNDRNMFWKTVWKKDIMSANNLSDEDCVQIPSGNVYELHDLCERTAYFYLSQLCKVAEKERLAPKDWHLQCMLRYADHSVKQICQDANRKISWSADTIEHLVELQARNHTGQVDLELIHRLGSKLPAIVGGSEPGLQILRQDGLLEQLYTDGLGVPETNGHLGTILEHLVHQYPRMRILEVGAGTGGSTSVALQSMGTTLGEYTFTDVSPSYFPAAQARFAEHERFLKFQVLDIERSPTEQGFQPHSYDLVIAAHVLHATKSIAQTIQNCRELLRPGGFLILLELTNMSTLRIPFLFSPLPGWWLGHDDGRINSPTLTEAQWEAVLKDNRFSGVDRALRDYEDESMHSFSVMVSQATDHRVDVLREPLSQFTQAPNMHDLVIIGGRALAVSKMAAKVRRLLTPFAGNIVIINDIEDVPRKGVTYGSAVICLASLEEAAFARMTPLRVAATQTIFREAKHVLWATRGSRCDDPYANIIVGIGRSASREMANLRLKFVDMEQIYLQKHQPEASLLAEMLLQMICLDQPDYGDILWSNETEVAVEDGAVLIPRVIADKDQNDSLNSTRRKILKSLSPVSGSVTMLNGDNGLVLEETSDCPPACNTSLSTLQVLSSSAFRFTFSDEDVPSYICLGYFSNMGQRALVITKSSGPSILVPADSIISCECIGSADATLSEILTVAMCESLLSSVKGVVWIHGADDSIGEIIYHIAKHNHTPLFLTTSDKASSLLSARKSTYLHPRASDRDLKHLIPRGIKKFVSMRSEGNNFINALGGDVDIQAGIYHMSVQETIALACSKSDFANLVARVQVGALREIRDLAENTIVKADRLHELAGTMMPTAVVSWTDVQAVQVQVRPATSRTLFADQKTYFLVGLTGDVGLSLCDWMTDHGAKYLAIASRRPAIAPEVLAHYQKKGVTVRIFSLDVSDMSSLKRVHQEIVSSMPPIAGVANAALVVRDHPFDSMPFEDLEAVFGPKVVGTQNLDNLFYSAPLDFFILFASIASVVGKPAQSSYNAANLFMSTLAAKRRKRGLAASAMHFGMLLGFGFIHGQAGPTVEARFRQDDLPAIPEPEFHEIFAQAIISGRPDSVSSPDIIAGLGTEIDTPWRAIPRFWHCRVKGEERRETDKRQDDEQPIPEQLKEAVNVTEAQSILRKAVAGRVSLALGSPGGDVDDNAGLISLGLDSLVAVEIRSWLLKVLEVDIPVLKLLSGSSLKDLCRDIWEKLPSALKPSEGGTNSTTQQANGLVNGIAKTNGKANEKRHQNGINGARKEIGVNGIQRTNGVFANGDKPSYIDQHTARNPEMNGSNGHHVQPPMALQEQFVVNAKATDLPIQAVSLAAPTEQMKQQPAREPSYQRIGDMSHAQSQLYFLHEYLQNNAHNVAYSGRFHGRLNMDRLKEALWVVGKRHEAMRSAYYLDMATSRPVQAVLHEPRITLEHKSVSESEAPVETRGVKDFVFEIEKGVVMKVVVMSHSPMLHSILFSHHHIALDGLAWSAFISELAQAYSGRLSSSSAGLQQSIEMAKRQLKSLAPENVKADLDFWKQTYKTIPEPLPLFPFSKVKTRPAVRDYMINTCDTKLPASVTRLIEQAASRINVTPFHFYLASLVTFLSRCLGIDDISVGVVDANRTAAEDMQTMGYYLNMLPVRIKLDQSQLFNEVAKEARDAAAAALAHQRAPVDMVLGELGISRSTAHHPLFQVAINYRKAPLNETSFGSDGKIEWDGAVPGGNPYDLFLNVASTSDWTFVSFITSRSLYEAADGELLLKWYTRALEALAQDPLTEVRRCPISNNADIKAAVDLGRGNDVEVPWKGTLADRVTDVAAAFPTAIAVRDDEGETLTYSQMSAITAQFMRQLQAVSPPLTPGSRVALLLDPVADALCCILAILRLGLVWVPLDSLNHQRRLRAVVKESRPRVLMCHSSTRKLAQQIIEDLASTAILDIDGGSCHVNGKRDVPTGVESNNIAPGKPAMIIYTSGSTGTPKGVVLTHEGLMNQIYGTTTTLNLGRETTLQQSPLGFDLMLDQIFLALCNGGTVVMVGKAGRGDPTHISQLMVNNNVSLTHFVPSEYLALLNYGHHTLMQAHSWRYAMSGGEKLGHELRRAFHRLNCQNLNLVNVYGPAEISIACAKGVIPKCELDNAYDVSDHLRTSPNYGIEIVDEEMNLLPIGFPGEICVTGRGVGLGYLDRPEETSLKFTQRQHTSSSLPVRIYRSGDKGRLLPDGTVKILGRIDGDSQVKIHGFRVELDEIANAIVQISNGTVVNAAASWRPSHSSGLLVAFVVFDAGFGGDKNTFLEWLRANFPLPAVMRPTFIIPTGRIPSTANGKIDRSAVDALPIPESSDAIANGTVAQIFSPSEQAMKEIWEQVLSDVPGRGHAQAAIQPSSDFFQVGGNSILMIKLKSLIDVQLGVKITMPELFHSSTLSSMASLLDSAASSTDAAASEATGSFLKPKVQHQAIDWDLEMASMVDGLPQPSADLAASDHAKMNANGGLVVVLTGATGFIGRHLLSQLVQDPRISQVHCIAIRPDAEGNPRHVSIKSNKIIEYPGDLSTLGLGLAHDQFTYLAEHADAIIHNGADVSLLKTYQSLRGANVISTRTLCEMAIPRRIPVHYVSTASVAKVVDLPDGEPLLEVAASPALPSLLNAVDGYAATKWASETLLDKAAESSGLPGYVHRLAHVVGDDASELDAIGMMTKYSLLLRTLPRIKPEDVTGKWDFVTAEDVVHDMVASVIESVSGHEQPTRALIINHCNDVKVSQEELRGYLESVAGEPLREVGMMEWLAAAREKGLHPLVDEFFAVFDEGQGKMVLPVIAKAV